MDGLILDAFGGAGPFLWGMFLVGVGFFVLVGLMRGIYLRGVNRRLHRQEVEDFEAWKSGRPLWPTITRRYPNLWVREQDIRRLYAMGYELRTDTREPDGHWVNTFELRRVPGQPLVPR
jgi:hypothetical protein